MRHVWRSENLVVAAQILTLVSLLLGLRFLFLPTGGSAFLFSVVSPGLTALALLAILGVAWRRFHHRHSLFRLEKYRAGEVIFQRGDQGDSAYFIEEGAVEVLHYNAEGEPLPAAILGRGQCFGDLELVLWGRRSATMRALEPTRVAVLSKENFFALCRVVQPVRARVMKALQEQSPELGAWPMSRELVRARVRHPGSTTARARWPQRATETEQPDDGFQQANRE